MIAQENFGNTWIKRVSLADLMINSDIIIVGTVPELPTSRGDYYITEIEVEKFIASVWSHKDTQKRMVRKKEECNKIFLVKKLPFSTGDLVMDPVLLREGKFLFWPIRLTLVTTICSMQPYSGKSCLIAVTI